MLFFDNALIRSIIFSVSVTGSVDCLSCESFLFVTYNVALLLNTICVVIESFLHNLKNPVSSEMEFIFETKQKR